MNIPSNDDVSQFDPQFTYKRRRNELGSGVEASRYIEDARDMKHRALIWFIISLAQLVFFASCLFVPAVLAALKAQPISLVPCLPLLLGAIFYVAYGYNHDHEKAMDIIRQQQTKE